MCSCILYVHFDVTHALFFPEGEFATTHTMNILKRDPRCDVSSRLEGLIDCISHDLVAITCQITPLSLPSLKPILAVFCCCYIIIMVYTSCWRAEIALNGKNKEGLLNNCKLITYMEQKSSLFEFFYNPEFHYF